MNETNAVISVKGLKTYYPLRKPHPFAPTPLLRANDDVSLEIRRGETFGLVGESGCGKSTLGRAILRLTPVTSGEVRYFSNGTPSGVDILRLNKKELRALRKDLQIVFQDPYSSLNPRKTVWQLIAEGPQTHGFFKGDKAALRAHVQETLQKCGLDGYALHRYPHQFSGGQRQRICIARALAVRPKFMVCDECVSALDVSVQSQILNLLKELKEKESLTYLFISHDLSVVRHVADRIAVMYLGRIVELGTAKQVFSTPRHPYTVALLSAAPTTEKSARKKILLQGSMPSAVNIPKGCPFHTRCFMAQEYCQRVPAPLVELKNGHFVACHFAEKSTAEKRKIAFAEAEKDEKIQK